MQQKMAEVKATSNVFIAATLIIMFAIMAIGFIFG